VGEWLRIQNVRHILFVLTLVCGLPLSAQAHCFDYAAQRFDVDADILRAIARVESNFNHKAMNVNNNKSYDIGMMQINSIHKSALEKAGVKMEDLMEPCTNVIVGAWILKGSIERAGGDTWKGVGYYHSSTPKFYEVYISKVKKAFANR
jgi:soluble lytic murein transglycosylase-like protein